MWEALASLPRLRAAVLAGEVSWSVARRAVAHATPETDGAFADALRGRTVLAAEAILRAAFGSAAARVGPAAGAGDESAVDSAERVLVRVPLSAAHHGRWHAAVELARRVAGEALPVWECVEAMAGEALGALPPAAIARAASAASAEAAATHGPRLAKRTSRARQQTPHEHGLRREAFAWLRWDRRAAGTQADLARLGPAGSAVANAFRDGALSPRQAALVAQAVPPARQPQAVAFARSVTLRRLEDVLGTGGAEQGAVSFAAPPEAASVFLVALEAVRSHLCEDQRPGASSARRAVCIAREMSLGMGLLESARVRSGVGGSVYTQT